MVFDNGRGGKTSVFLSKSRSVLSAQDRSGHEVTHTFMDGGRVSLSAGDVGGFHQALAADLAAGTVPCLTERRSPLHFPMYADLDLKVPVPVLTDETAVKLAAVVNRQMQRFFDESAPLTLVVCTKNNVAPKADEEGLYKHGVHFHWPNVIVDAERALRMRAAMIVALEREEWQEDLGARPVDWVETVDESVYASGLRLLGAPKAKMCHQCRGKSGVHCTVCANMRYLYDPAVYGLRTVLVGEAVDPDQTRSLGANAVRLLRATTVRAPEGTALTEGYRVFVGCPPAETGRKRKGCACVPAGVEARYKRKPPITDPAVLAVLRKLLVQHSEHYAHSRMTVLGDGTSYRVALSGEGGNFCLNKGTDHGSQHVYMIVERAKSKSYAAYMKCFSRKPTCDRVTGQPCKDFKSNAVYLDADQVACLFRAAPRGAEAAWKAQAAKCARLAAEA